MNILDDTENGIPAEDEDDMESYHSDVEALMNEDGGDYEPQDEAGDPEVRKQTIYSSASVQFLSFLMVFHFCPLQVDECELLGEQDDYMMCPSIKLVCSPHKLFEIMLRHLNCHYLKFFFLPQDPDADDTKEETGTVRNVSKKLQVS